MKSYQKVAQKKKGGGLGGGYLFACVKEGVKACQDALWHFCQGGDFMNCLKSVLKKCAPECPVECRGVGWGVQSLFGQCPNVGLP